MTGPANAAIDVRHLTVRFARAVALEDVCLEVPLGAVVGVVGPNGGGKTVLLRSLLGFVEPAAGTVRVLGDRPDRVRGRVAYVPQQAPFDLDFPITVRRLVATGLLRAAAARDQREGLIDNALERVGLRHRQDSLVGTLSGGQLQRGLVARALVMDAEVVLMDEPTSSLDRESSARVYAGLDELRGNRAVLMVTHDDHGIRDHADQIVYLDRRIRPDATHGVPAPPTRPGS